MKKIPVALIGATGIVGQRYLLLLANHPWFELTFIAASDQSAGRRYKDAVRGRWLPHEPIPEPFGDMLVQTLSHLPSSCRIVFSAGAGGPLPFQEQELVKQGYGVVSHNSVQRLRPEVPLIIPEINPDHLSLLPKEGGWLLAKPNCSIQSYLLPLFPLHKPFGLRQIQVTMLQALSGAGIQAMGMCDNAIPYIEGEEEKCEQEPLKVLGEVRDGVVVPATGPVISAQCNRVAVVDGHLACVSVSFERKPQPEEILEIWRSFRGLPQELALPSAPLQPIHYTEEPDRPQPLRDADLEGGMAVLVGRLRPCPLFHYRFVALSHNVVRGAAGGALLTLELALHQHEHLRHRLGMTL